MKLKVKLLVIIICLLFVSNVSTGLFLLKEKKEVKRFNELSLHSFISEIESSISILDDILLGVNNDNYNRTINLLSRLKRMDAISEFNNKIYYSNFFYWYSIILEDTIKNNQKTEDISNKLESLKASLEEVYIKFSNAENSNIVVLSNLIKSVLVPEESKIFKP